MISSEFRAEPVPVGEGSQWAIFPTMSPERGLRRERWLMLGQRMLARRGGGKGAEGEGEGEGGEMPPPTTTNEEGGEGVRWKEREQRGEAEEREGGESNDPKESAHS